MFNYYSVSKRVSVSFLHTYLLVRSIYLATGPSDEILADSLLACGLGFFFESMIGCLVGDRERIRTSSVLRLVTSWLRRNACR